MKIELSIDSHQLTNSVNDLLANLSEEQKQELTKQVLATVFIDLDHKLDEKICIKNALTKFRKACEEGRDYSCKPEYLKLTDEQLMNEYYSRRAINEFIAKEKSFKTDLLTNVSKSIVDKANKLIEKQINSDPQIQSLISKMLESIKEDFPKFVQNAMTMFLVKNMQDLMMKTENSLMRADIQEDSIKSLVEKLNS